MVKGLQLLAYALVIQKYINASELHINYHLTNFDTDYAKIGIDNRCSACISHKIDGFIGPFKDNNRYINGCGGEIVYDLKTGKIQWKWCNYQGKLFIFCIPNPVMSLK